ncbi:HD domain-containing protein, partial [bacterium]|nr:HD domain-containing protein [bacterium]
NKKGPLDTGEAAIMQRHPVTGCEICKRLRSIAGVIPLVRHHHEKLDGSGYPDGLRGDEISISARIMAVTDIYDACTSNRAYRDAMSGAEACELLDAEAAAGKLDRDLVDLFFSKVLPYAGADGAPLVQDGDEPPATA